MKDVILFTTQTCPHCKTAKAFLKQNHIQFVEKDVNVDAAAQQEMVEVFEEIETERIGLGTHERFHAMLNEFKQKYLKK